MGEEQPSSEVPQQAARLEKSADRLTRRIYDSIVAAIEEPSEEIPEEIVRGTVEGQTQYKVQSNWFTSSWMWSEAALDSLEDPAFADTIKSQWSKVSANLRKNQTSGGRNTHEDVAAMNTILTSVRERLEVDFPEMARKIAA